MKCIVRIVFCVIAMIILHRKHLNASIWIKNVKSYAPSSISAGTNCLTTMTRHYFKDPTIPRTKNMVVSYTQNISLAAEQIQKMYLAWVHEMIARGNLDDMELQLISNKGSVDKIKIVPMNAIYETDYYVLVMDSLGKFNQLMRQYISRASFNPGAKFIILFNNPKVRLNSEKENGLAFNIFRLMYDRYNAANVIFLYAANIDTYNVYVTNPYRNENECGSLMPILLDTCKNGTLKNDLAIKKWIDIPKIPKKLPNCTFKFCARVTDPYVKEGCESGLEMEIISVLQDILKFKINTFCASNMARGEPFGNGSWSGILGMLRDDQCDFVVGGFFPDDDVHDDFGVTGTYLQDSYTWYVYIAPKQPPWKGMITIFQYNTWLVCCLIFILSTITWFCLGYSSPEKAAHKKIVLCMLNSWALFLGISANNRPNWSPLRLFFVFFALYSLNVTTIYTSKLITVFTHPPYEEQIDTISEIIESKLPIGGRQDYHDWFDNDNPDDRIFYKLYNSSEAFWPSIINLQSVADGQRVILMNRIYVTSKSLDTVFAVPGDVIINPLEMISERGFPLLKRFSRIIMYMIDAGIVGKLYNDFYYNVTILEKIRNHHNIEPETQIVLTLDHMNGAFMVLVLGLSISSLVFIGELLFDYQNRRKIAKRLWRRLRIGWRNAKIWKGVKQHKEKAEKVKTRKKITRVKAKKETNA